MQPRVISRSGTKIKPDWFLLGMAAAIALAWAFPEPGATGGWMRPELLTKGGVALIFFLHGLLLSFAALRAGVMNWRLHAVVQACTFLLFPLLGLLVLAALGERATADLRLGFFFLCAVPSTVSSSIAMTSAARGNVAGAVFNATLSSLIGVVLTPLWLAAVMKTTGQSPPLAPVIWDLLQWLVLPLALGQAARPWLGEWAKRHRAGVALADRGTILLLVYTSFCQSFQQNIWAMNGAGDIALVLAICAGLFTTVMLLTAAAARVWHFTREDRVAAMFCGSKKSLAAGVPMANLIFGASGSLAVILLPLMLYHALQLVLCGGLAQRWGRLAIEREQQAKAMRTENPSEEES